MPQIVARAALLILLPLAACGPTYSPDTYNSNAVQQANKVEQGVVVGMRRVGVSADAAAGTVAGAAAGGVAGSQSPGGNVASAFGAIGGGVVGGLMGATVSHAAADTDAYEYIVRKSNNDLVSVTQRDKTPLMIGQKVLVISGNQARVIPDYTVPAPPSAEHPKPSASALAKDDKAKDDKAADKPATASSSAPPAGNAQTSTPAVNPAPSPAPSATAAPATTKTAPEPFGPPAPQPTP